MSGDTMWRWWPCFIAGFCGPWLAHALVRWMTPSLALGLAFFLMWVVVGLIFTVSPPSSGWRLARWTAAGAVGAIIAGVAAFIIHG